MKRPLAAALVVAPAVLAAGVASAGIMAISPVAPVPHVEPVSGLVDGTLDDTGLPIDLPALPAVGEIADPGALTTPVAEAVQEILPQAVPVLPPGILATVAAPVLDVAAAPVATLAPVANAVEQVAGTSAVATVEAVADSLGLPLDVPALPALPALDPAALLDTVNSTVAGLGLPISLPGVG